MKILVDADACPVVKQVEKVAKQYNIPSVCIYEKLGFVRTGSVETDIGGGYIMDDYIYEFTL